MYNSLFKNLAQHVNLSPEELDLVSAKVRKTIIAKNHFLLQEKGHSRMLYFVEKGCLRVFSTDDSGKETNVLFAPENWWACDIYSFTNGKASRFSIEALEESLLLGIHHHDLEELFHSIPKLERFFRILFQNAFGLYQRRLSLVLSAPAKDRYKFFKKQYPTLELRISQKHIASYLGITTVFLSNIRKQKS